MRKMLAVTVVIVLSTANSFAGRPTPIPVTSIPTLSEWGVFGAVAVLGLVGVFFLVRHRKHGCCN